MPILFNELGPDVLKFMLPIDQYESYASAWLHAFKIREILIRNPNLGQIREAPKSFPTGIGIKDLFENLFPDAYLFAHANPEHRDYKYTDKFCRDIMQFLEANIKLSRSPADKIMCFYCKKPNHLMTSCEKLQNKIQKFNSLGANNGLPKAGNHLKQTNGTHQRS